MAKVDVVAAAVAAVQAGQLQVLNDQFSSVFDQAEAQGTGPGFTQADIDSAVAAAVGPLNDQITALTAQDQADIAAGQVALTNAQTATAAVQASLDALTAKEAPEASLIASLQQSAASLTTALAAINAALNPVVAS